MAEKDKEIERLRLQVQSQEMVQTELAQLRATVKQLQENQESKLYENQKIVQAKLEIKELHELMQSVAQQKEQAEKQRDAL